MRVKISVRGGVAYVDEVPPGVIVEVVDYDVDPASLEHDEAGEPCSPYEVPHVKKFFGGAERAA